MSNQILKDIRYFEHYPEQSSCFLCGTKDDATCILIPIDGTWDGSIEEAQPVHLKCVTNNLRMNKGLKIIYAKGI